MHAGKALNFQNVRANISTQDVASFYSSMHLLRRYNANLCELSEEFETSLCRSSKGRRDLELATTISRASRQLLSTGTRKTSVSS